MDVGSALVLTLARTVTTDGLDLMMDPAGSIPVSITTQNHQMDQQNV